MNSFKDALKFLRKKRGLTQKELADKLGISASAITMYEQGKREPNFELLEEIADYFNVEMNFLLGKETKRKEPYYITIETKEIAEFLFNNPDFIPLVKKSIRLDPKNIELVTQLIEKMI